MRLTQFFSIAALAATVFSAPVSAATVSISLAGSLPAPATPETFDASSGTVYYDRTDSISGSWWSPWNGTAYDGVEYTSVQAGSWGEYSFSAPQTSITLLWGTPDWFNTISFWSNGSEIGSLTGLNLTNYLGVAARTTSFVTLLPESVFDTVRFFSSRNSLEFANFTSTPAPVPLPAAGLLLVGAIGGLGVIARKRRMAA